jgi:hypothetical protein
MRKMPRRTGISQFIKDVRKAFAIADKQVEKQTGIFATLIFLVAFLASRSAAIAILAALVAWLLGPPIFGSSKKVQQQN